MAEEKEKKNPGKGFVRDVFLPFAAAFVLTELAESAALFLLDWAAGINGAAAGYFLAWPGDRELIALFAGLLVLLGFVWRSARTEILYVQEKPGVSPDPADISLMLAVSVFAALAVNGTVLILGGALGRELTGAAASGSAAAAMHLVPAFAVYVFLAPLAEESLFRGVLFVRLGKRTGFLPAAFLSAALFSLWHGTGTQAVYALVMGMLFAAAFARTRIFPVPVLLHSAANAAVFLMLVAFDLSKTLSRPWVTALFALSAAMGIWLIKNKHSQNKE